ncbi:single-stranded DNA-binding protein [Carboxylicivirga sp. A043]|uniref:single-stranded DNA-binding protein n=1 Tax=Carboxylicivirga litoralis TaxID=2816963 RepID=UPI0021CB1CFC|nr:single-stranded DNA-binding protein [Carboxylicivirga sp. A043]MCU4156520.1 single-stranded DNA-binding protein [Carboxylicivirga sp. A043]
MANLRNRVQLVGNLGMNPEVKAFDNGRKLAKFTLATNENFNSANGQERTETQWHNIIAWGKQAEIAQKYLQKGNEVAIEGRLTHRQYEDKNKETRYVTEVVLSSYVLFPGMRK